MVDRLARTADQRRDRCAQCGKVFAAEHGEEQIVDGADFPADPCDRLPPGGRHAHQNAAAVARIGPLVEQAALGKLAGFRGDERARNVKRVGHGADAHAILFLQVRNRDQHAVLRPAYPDAIAKMLAHELHSRRDGQEIVHQSAEAAIRTDLQQRRPRHRQRQHRGRRNFSPGARPPPHGLRD